MENKPTQLASLMHPTSRTVYELASAKPPPSEEYKALLRHHRDALAPAADLMSEDPSFTARERAVLIFGVSIGLGNGEGGSVQDTLASFQVPRPPACGKLRFVRLARWGGGGLSCSLRGAGGTGLERGAFCCFCSCTCASLDCVCTSTKLTHAGLHLQQL